jgi:hypothetical protein
MAGHNRAGPSSGNVTPIGKFQALIIRSMSGLKQIERTRMRISCDTECVFILITWLCKVPVFIRHDKGKRH